MSDSKQIVTTRGLQYNYLVSTPTSNNQTILFLHGFPSTARDWRYQMAFFKELGFGVIAPDMLGYGGTAKPTDPKLYKASTISADIIDILNHERVHKAVVVGHDWGCKIVSRLANLYPDRFLGYAFLVVPYTPPNPHFNLDVVLEHFNTAIGYEPFGYWKFLASEKAADLIENNLESFFSILYPSNPDLWRTDMAQTGAMENWISSGRVASCPPYITEEDKAAVMKGFREHGFSASLCWYKAAIDGTSNEDDLGVDKGHYGISQPVFFGGAKKDPVCLSQFGAATCSKTCSHLTFKEFDSAHWPLLECPKELNTELLAWINTVKSRL